MAKRPWWPAAKPAQLVLVQNFLAKFAAYAAALGFTPAQVAAAVALCEAYIGAFNATEQCKQSMLAMTAWREEVFYGQPEDKPASAAPVFPVVGTVTYRTGTVPMFFALRDLIIASPGYTQGIGEDLGIVGAEITPSGPEQTTPVFKSVTTNGYTVNLSGSMQGFDALKVEYARKGGTFSQIAFLTKTPGGFTITPATPGAAEAGHIRAVFIKKNVEYGNYSADYPVTVS